MKTLSFTLTLILSVLFTFSVNAQDAAPADEIEVSFSEAAAAFDELTQTGLSKVSISEASGVAVGEATAVSVGGTVCQTAIKVWFQLAKDGKFVNPVLQRWDPKERFRVFVQSSVPVYFAMYQTYPEDRPATKQIYPDKRYPQTFYAVPAGKIFEVPVKFEMDNDLRKETIQLTFARIDEPAIGGTVIVSATATATASAAASVGGSDSAAAAVAETLIARTDSTPVVSTTAAAASAAVSRGVLMSAKNVNTAMDYLSKVAIADGAAASATASVCVASRTVTSNSRDDVAVYVFGVGRTAQTQLTLNK